MMRSSLLLMALSTSSSCQAFQAPVPMATKTSVTALAAGLNVDLDWSSLFNTGDSTSSSQSLVHVANDVTGILNHQILMAEGALDIVRNIALGITAVIFLLAGITYLYASFIIPAAAQELEKECKELDPQLWEQYAAKLQEGETMAQRPDLMQELGMKLQPMLEAKIARQEQAKRSGGSGSIGVPTPLETTMNPFNEQGSGNAPATSATSTSDEPNISVTSANQWDSNDNIIDVVVEKKSSDENNGADKKK